MPRIYPLVAGLAAPLLPTFLIACLCRALRVDDVPSVAYAVFGFGGLLAGVVAGYEGESDPLFYGVAVGVLAGALIVLGVLVNAVVNPASALFISVGRLIWLCVTVLAASVLGAKFGETRARRERREPLPALRGG